MTLHAATMATPTGPLTVLADDNGVRAAGFVADAGSLQERLPPPLRRVAVRTVPDLGRLTAALAAYLDGDVRALDAIPAVQPGGVFFQRAWAAMRAVPPGRTLSYADLAAAAGSPSAVRAAGSACARNLLAPIVPCHRVVRTDGSLGGYAYGLPVKRWLLNHERRAAGSPARQPAPAARPA